MGQPAKHETGIAIGAVPGEICVVRMRTAADCRGMDCPCSTALRRCLGFCCSCVRETYLHAGRLLRQLRAGMRTEPNVRLAVLFGSVATGRESADSDVDLLVVLRDPGAATVAALAQRLSDRLDREVQLVRTEEAERSPVLMADVLAQGRVLVDRDGAWVRLKAAESRWQRRAASEDVPLTDSIPDLELS